MIKLTELLGDEYTQEADKWADFLQKEMKLDTLKKRFNAKYLSDDDLAITYFQVIDDINTEPNE